VSFAGGGTDLPSFYRAHDGGAVCVAAVDKFIHVLVNDKFDRSIRIAYSRTENVDRLDDLQHEIFREALRLAGVTEAVEIHTIADIPGEGTGLGSSSSLTVGLLNALHAYRGTLRDPVQLAEEACRIEIDLLGGALGKQDQYAAALGGIQYLEFRPDDSVRSTPIPLSTADRRTLSKHLSLFYTGVTRKAQGLLKAQADRTAQNVERYVRMREQALETREAIQRRDWERVGQIMHSGWELKRALADDISTASIDLAYQRARAAGAWGGKITGAGGGGFLLLVHPPEKTHDLEAALAPMRRLPVEIMSEGSRIIFVHR
jgi:D-glycero-alpha-D-manno-heptose-7-phosphate kinase